MKITPDWVSAVGTVLAVVVALGLASGQTVWGWINRPRLKVSLGSEEPYVRPQRDGFELTGLILRAGVKNIGKREALAVHGQVTAWWSKANQPGYVWIESDIDPMILHWVGVTERRDTTHGTTTALAPDTSDYLELVKFLPSQAKTSLHPHEIPTGPTHLLESNYPLGEQRIEIVVSASNAKIVKCVISYMVSQEKFFTDIHFSDSPPKDAVLRGGYLNILSQGRGEAESEN